MGKNIVVFSDGTGQDGGTRHNTNVYKLFNLILDRSQRQISFYDPGLGTGLRKATGNIAGRGFSENVLQCYRFIFDNFEVDDKIFLFGFSRGAATVRSLTGFIHLFGILPRSRSKLIKKAWNIYKIGDDDKRRKRAEEFREVNHNMWATVRFLGVWDTVAALGVPDSRIDRILNWIVPHGFHDFTLSESVDHACHALAIDDARKTFHPVLFERKLKRADQTLKQVWFMGMHTDVGGGYEEKELSDITLEWMVQHAVRHGLHIYKPKERERPSCTPDPNGMMHNSRDKLWKRVIFKAAPRKWDMDRYGEPVIHESVTLRTAGYWDGKDGPYQPWILKHNSKTERWTHLADWKADPSFTKETKQDLEALEGWCVPKTPPRSPAGDA
jgi:uncharacterized protein (DUF2235 family)